MSSSSTVPIAWAGQADAAGWTQIDKAPTLAAQFNEVQKFGER
jgi:hypothetical protein